MTQTVPARFAAAMAEAEPAVRDQPELTVAYTIEGDDGAHFWIRIADGALTVSQEEITPCDMRVTFSYDNWRAAVEHNSTEWFVDFYLRRKIEVVKGLQGTVSLELTRTDETTYEAQIIFGEQPEPELTVYMTTDDYAAMMSGELDGNMAFMTGKLTFDGSLPLLLKLGALSG
jgi:putative sterol carrier protein